MKNRLNKQRNQLRYETFEPRQMLASISLDSGLLKIVGTSGNDNVRFIERVSTGIVEVLDASGGAQPVEFASDKILEVEFYGLSGNDTFTVASFATSAMLGLDSITFAGGDGDDSFEYGLSRASGVDVVAYGGDGDDRLVTQTSFDLPVNRGVRFYGGGGDDTLEGGFGSDILVGHDGADHISGNAGNDTIRGGSGEDVLDGGTQSDSIFGGDGDDTITGGSNGVVLSRSPSFSGDVVAVESDTVYGGNGNDTITGGYGPDLLAGNAGDDVIEGENGADSIFGGDGNDTLRGGNGIDRIFGQNGHDNISGGNDDDFISAGEGRDRAFGDHGNDRIMGGPGNDELRGGDGDDELYGGLGDDGLFGHQGNDKLNGYLGNDRLFGGFNDDIIVGGEGDDFLHGHAGDDVLIGNADDDRLVGGDGNDLLNAGSENDVLIGGRGEDRLTSGLGTDTFVYVEGDVMLDFDSADDYASKIAPIEFYIGLTTEQAFELADQSNRRRRVVSEDGESFLSTADYWPNRLNLTIENGLVVSLRTDSGFEANPALLDSYIGVTRERAYAVASADGRVARDVWVDGDDLAQTEDVVARRINFQVLDGTIVGAYDDADEERSKAPLGTYVGLHEDMAAKLAEANDRLSRVVERDNAFILLDNSYVSDRLNFTVFENVIAGVSTDLGDAVGSR